MGASSATELYRFNEDEQCSTYDSFTHLSYFDDECMVAGLVKFNRSMRNELFDHLRSKGIKWIRYKHKGRKRMIYLGD